MEKVREDDVLTEDNAVEGRRFVTKSHCFKSVLLMNEMRASERKFQLKEYIEINEMKVTWTNEIG